jgi:hypothetical protein
MQASSSSKNGEKDLKYSKKSFCLSHSRKVLDGSGGDRVDCHDACVRSHRSKPFYAKRRRLRIHDCLRLHQMLFVTADFLGFLHSQINEGSHQLQLLEGLIIETLLAIHCLI